MNKRKGDGPPAPGGPVIINETLFSGSQDSNVYAIPLADLKWEKLKKNWPGSGRRILVFVFYFKIIFFSLDGKL
ncbi:hypothetical protein [Bacillus marinisedimentorum]|uniref:hypothetical protein n=1 Tax=Bacillus marinisedimentorum TaxID=1821260 RepID=UPI0008722E30|nr:hypothetical protein [Bacillus marinisedimentorum]